jgi:hypothetical protein
VSEFLAAVRSGVKPGPLLSRLLAVFHNFIGAAWDPAGGDVRGDIAPPSREEVGRLAHAVAGPRTRHGAAHPYDTVGSRHAARTAFGTRSDEEENSYVADLIEDHEDGLHRESEEGPDDDCPKCD